MKMAFNRGDREPNWESNREKAELRWRTKENTSLEGPACVGGVWMLWTREARDCTDNTCFLVKKQS